MKRNNRRKHLASFVQQIASITTRVAPFHEGIELRFINAATMPAMPNPSLNQINQILEQNPFNGWTEIGINLKKKVLEENVYRWLEEDNLQRPVLVHVITDGRPDGPERSLEREDTLPEVIVECSKKLAEHGYEKDVVRFQISQIGNDPSAEMYLNNLVNNPELNLLNTLYITAGE
ncbi:uncharacterized protein N7483_007648 [Penicillium malachiteum]|uniref:uncharacterized protein n=1 Tax=Penicillium malachiteum TaxID=1324776 RepID=UPI002546BF24|nr:uncharacterized protein N7483_007648 [Penicillium malachiteum]KAJ5726291.1 hypothetical protein N7483_007648 [Penicillium malachiteum]